MGPHRLDLSLRSQVLRSEMETLSQHLKKKKKWEEDEWKAKLHRYLDKLMEVTPHNIIGRHPREHFQVICTKDVLSTCQGNLGIIPDAGGSGVNLLLLLIPVPWLLMLGSKLFH